MAWAQQAVSNYDRNKYFGQCCCALGGRVDEVDLAVHVVSDLSN